jgi:hypothetical protein
LLGPGHVVAVLDKLQRGGFYSLRDGVLFSILRMIENKTPLTLEYKYGGFRLSAAIFFFRMTRGKGPRIERHTRIVLDKLETFPKPGNERKRVKPAQVQAPIPEEREES